MMLPHVLKRICLHLARSKEFPSGSASQARWVFDYDASRTDDDEAGYRFGVHAFAPGEYVSIRDDEDELHTFKVMTVEPAT